MSVVGHQRAGKGSRISANAVIMTMAEWTTAVKRPRLDTTNFESQGLFQGLTAVQTTDINCKGNWDAQKNAFDSPPGIFPQDFFPNLLLYENLADNVGWNFPLMLIDSAENGANVNQLVTFGWGGCANGTFSEPTGSV